MDDSNRFNRLSDELTRFKDDVNLERGQIKSQLENLNNSVINIQATIGKLSDDMKPIMKQVASSIGLTENISQEQIRRQVKECDIIFNNKLLDHKKYHERNEKYWGLMYYVRQHPVASLVGLVSLIIYVVISKTPLIRNLSILFGS